MIQLLYSPLSWTGFHHLFLSRLFPLSKFSMSNFRVLSPSLQWHNATLSCKGLGLAPSKISKIISISSCKLNQTQVCNSELSSTAPLLFSLEFPQALRNLLCFSFQSFQNKTDKVIFLSAPLQGFVGRATKGWIRKNIWHNVLQTEVSGMML